MEDRLPIRQDLSTAPVQTCQIYMEITDPAGRFRHRRRIHSQPSVRNARNAALAHILYCQNTLLKELFAAAVFCTQVLLLYVDVFWGCICNNKHPGKMVTRELTCSQCLGHKSYTQTIWPGEWGRWKVSWVHLLGTTIALWVGCMRVITRWTPPA